MAQKRDYWFERNADVVAADADGITLIFKVGGVPEDISGWTFTYGATADWTVDTIAVADGAMTKSASLGVVTDTVHVPLSVTDTDIDFGKYDEALVVLAPTDKRTVFRGTINIVEERT